MQSSGNAAFHFENGEFESFFFSVSEKFVFLQSFFLFSSIKIYVSC